MLGFVTSSGGSCVKGGAFGAESRKQGHLDNQCHLLFSTVNERADSTRLPLHRRVPPGVRSLLIRVPEGDPLSPYVTSTHLICIQFLLSFLGQETKFTLDTSV